MKKTIVIQLLLFIFLSSRAQEPAYEFQELTLGKVMSAADQEFSGLYVFKNDLYVMPENKTKKVTGVFVLNIPELTKQTTGKSRAAKHHLLPFTNLTALIKKIEQRGQGYDGLEALTVTDKAIFFSVETLKDTCYIIKGKVRENKIEMDPGFLIALLKPRRANGEPTCNAGFEAMEFSGSDLVCFFEFNDVYTASMAVVNPSTGETSWKALARLPFRFTDVSWSGNNKLTGINYFYAGGGCDSIYEPEKNSADYHLANDKGKFKNLCRLIELEETPDGFNWKPVFNFPAPYDLFNWEGIAEYNGEFFLVNDRYTGQKQGSRLFVLKKR